MEEYIIIEQEGDIIILVESMDEEKSGSTKLLITHDNDEVGVANTDKSIILSDIPNNVSNMIAKKKIPLVMIDTESKIIFDVSVVEVDYVNK